MGNHLKKTTVFVLFKNSTSIFSSLENKTYEMLYLVLVFHMFGLD